MDSRSGDTPPVVDCPQSAWNCSSVEGRIVGCNCGEGRGCTACMAVRQARSRGKRGCALGEA
eukprot:3027630-Pleurochrysis_carterae.AAC.6